MQKSLILLFISLFSVHLFAQDFTDAGQSDPAAKKVLENMRKKYESYQSLKVDFSLEIEVPEQPPTAQKGSLVQQGDKYRLTLEDRTLVSDGASVWLYIEKNKEVQINDVEEDAEQGTLNSPKDILKAYEWENHVYALVNEFSENGQVIQQIEFKPTTRDADYSKIRLTVAKKSLDVVHIKTFSRDGSRYTLTINELTPNPAVNASTFNFTKSECPDCHFEDLRL